MRANSPSPAAPLSTASSVFARDGIFYVASAAIFFAALAATFYYCHTMSGGMEMPGGWSMSMMWMPMPGQSWPAAFIMFMSMWAAMMIAMMLPSSLRMISNYRTALRSAGISRVAIPTALMSCGYILIWLTVGAIVFAAGTPLAFAAMRWPALSRVIPSAAGASLIVAGALQFMPHKMTFLCRCRDMRACIASHTHAGRPATLGALRCGFACGRACAGCCAAPMLALIVVGMMNPFSMLSAASIIALEKLAPHPVQIVRLTGIAFALIGTAMIVQSVLA